MSRMRGARKKPNVAKLSGFTGAEVPKALAADGQRDLSKDTDRLLITKALTEEQKIKLKAAGYKVD